MDVDIAVIRAEMERINRVLDMPEQESIESRHSLACMLHDYGTHLLAALDAAQERERGLVKALEALMDDEPCRLDHHGYCQAHSVSKPCEMAVARAALAEPAR